MRDIKFRCWSPDNQEMYFPDHEYCFRMFNSGVSYQPHYDNDEFEYYSTDPCDGEKKIEVMQYTGLKDKEGNEIYESDIISLINADSETINVVCEYGIAQRTVVTMDGGVVVDIPCFYFKLPNERKTFPIVNNYAGKHDLELFEVIGNIYQHPHLLNQTE